MLLYYGLAPSYAQPLRKYGRRTGRVGADQRERLHWVEHLRAAAEAPTRNDPAVLPPAFPGQLPLFPVRRMLSIDICRRILQRPLTGYAELVEHTAAFAAETGVSKPMQRKLLEMLRLALAVRDADGDDHVDKLMLNDIPNYTRSVREILLRAGMLRAWEEPHEPRERQKPRTTGRPPAPAEPPGNPAVLPTLRLLVLSETAPGLPDLRGVHAPEEEETRSLHRHVRALPTCRPAPCRRTLPRMPRAHGDPRP